MVIRKQHAARQTGRVASKPELILYSLWDRFAVIIRMPTVMLLFLFVFNSRRI